jgi:RNA 3'-terminal phosphate cyclase (ATP)
MITIDGSAGEGGGQILRSSLALSLVTEKPFCIENIRAKRQKPGLLRQHLTAVKAAADVSQAKVDGDSIGSTRLSFSPGRVKGGSYHWSIGTAGSATLVLQAVLPALIVADENSDLTLEGGTQNPYAPPFDFLAQAFLPVINRMGPEVISHLERSGFYPAGGGRFSVTINPVQKLLRADLMERGEIMERKAVATISHLHRHIAETEIGTLRTELPWGPECFRIEESNDSRGPGNVVSCFVESRNITEVFTGLGKRGVPANRVASILGDEFRGYLSSGVPVGCYLADQLMVPMAVAGGGRFRAQYSQRISRGPIWGNSRAEERFLDCPHSNMPIFAVLGQAGFYSASATRRGAKPIQSQDTRR